MKKRFSLYVLIGLVLGILGGLLFPKFMTDISFLGTIYVNFLKFMIIPLIFTTITVNIYDMNKSKTKIFLKTILTFITMFVISFLVTSLLVWLLNPSKGFTFNVVNWDPTQITKLQFSEIVVNLFPSNLGTMIINNAVFATMVVAILMGISASKVKGGKQTIELLRDLKTVFSKILEYIMYCTPLAVFTLIGTTIANYGSMILGVGARYIGMAYLASLVVLILVMILPVWIFAKINPFTYIKKIYKVWLMTTTTCSSNATLPYTIKTCNEELCIPEEVTNLVVPLGCTINMCGGAVSFALLGLFCSRLFGIEVNIITYVLMLVSATLINMGAPGIPNGGIVIGATYLSMLGIPLSFIGFYSGIYKLLDMSYTTLNVTGDITANVLINHSLEKNKKGIFNSLKRQLKKLKG